MQDPDDQGLIFDREPETSVHPSPTTARHSRKHAGDSETQTHRRRSRRVLLPAAAIVVVAVLVTAFYVVPKLWGSIGTPDYSGAGSGPVLIYVSPGDFASDIGATLQKDGVVKSVSAFTDAAKKNNASQSLQPGTYMLRKQMSGKAALNLLLNPSSRDKSRDVVITEGETSWQVEATLVKVLGASAVPAIHAAMSQVADAGVPQNYEGSGGATNSVEGFLYPSMYPVPPNANPSSVVQMMVGRFVAEDRSAGFAAQAQKLGITPYQALIVASMIEREAVNDADRPKVARVIYNRLKQHIALGIDATSIYGARLADPAARVLKDQDIVDSINFQRQAPYNTRIAVGLPPTPISNPGDLSLKAAVAPAAGNWLYYVNSDATGGMYFTASASDFAAAEQRCKANKWGCS